MVFEGELEVIRSDVGRAGAKAESWRKHVVFSDQGMEWRLVAEGLWKHIVRDSSRKSIPFGIGFG